MSKIYLTKTFWVRALLLLFFIAIVLTHSCGDDETLNATGDHIGGTITFVNTLFRTSDGHYAITLYPDSANRFCLTPVRSDAITPSGSTLTFNIANLSAGFYYLAVTWVSNSGGSPYVLGTRGCDTAHTNSCSTYTRIELPAFAGTSQENFLSWTDPNTYIFHCP